MPKAGDLSLQSLGKLCLDHLAEDAAQLAEFMAATGYSPGGLRQGIGSDELNRGLIDYFASNESLLLAMTSNNGLRPEAFMRVWHQANSAD